MNYLIKLWVTCSICNGTGTMEWQEVEWSGGFLGYGKKSITVSCYGNCWQCKGSGKVPEYVDLDTFWHLLNQGR